MITLQMMMIPELLPLGIDEIAEPHAAAKGKN
jgi:hypothetical protein